MIVREEPETQVERASERIITEAKRLHVQRHYCCSFVNPLSTACSSSQQNTYVEGDDKSGENRNTKRTALLSEFPM